MAAEIFRMMTESRAQWWDVNVDEVRKLVEKEWHDSTVDYLELAGSVSVARVVGPGGETICKLMVRDNGELELIS